ncbi:MAG: tetratricopeptide repeat protein [Proteobacteria bacterium]|nr:MAG: tetratricopeptide repeat protein [Pseudomonadota bacterium]
MSKTAPCRLTQRCRCAPRFCTRSGVAEITCVHAAQIRVGRRSRDSFRISARSRPNSSNRLSISRTRRCAETGQKIMRRVILSPMPRFRAFLVILAVTAVASVTADETATNSQLAYAYEVFLSQDPSGPDSAEIWLKLANIRLQQSRYDEAREAYRHVAELGALEHSGDMENAGRLGVGLSLSGESRYAEAVKELEEAIRRAGNEPVRGNLVAIYRELANIGLQTDDYDAVIKYGGVARGAYETLGHWEDEALMLLAVGIAHAEKGARTLARVALSRSHRLVVERGDREAPDYAERAERVVRIARGYGIDTDDWE